MALRLHRLLAALWRRRTAVVSPPAIPEESLGRATGGKAVVYVDLADDRGRRMIEFNGSFNPDCVRIWQLLLASDDWTHVVDVGANYGEMLVNVSMPPRARVIAVEPNPHVLPYLERTLREAEVPAELVRKAIADRIGLAPLMLDRQWSGMTRLAEAGEAPAEARYELISVPTTTLAALLDDCGPAHRVRVAVKIDVEGHEPQVLQGIMDMIPALGRFAALAEIFHLSPEQLGWVFDRFEVDLFEPATGLFVRLQPPTPEGLAGLLETGRYYPHDAVLIPRQAAREA